jgi:N-acetyl-gamma-glutamyl-phosphate reductase
MSESRKTVALVGGRGHVGAELMQLLFAHPGFELILVSSREFAGQPVGEHVAGAPPGLHFEAATASEVAAREPDACILALPNGLAEPFVAAIDRPESETVIVDVSADYRFDNTWHYGLPELNRPGLPVTRISNPGCYATAMQLAIAPVAKLIAGAPHCFGVSGYSGAGTTPSPRNDPTRLRDNLMPYQPTGHLHEREVGFQLHTAVRFTPHVAGFFRGISMTVGMELETRHTLTGILQRYQDAYAGEPLVRVTEEIPEVADNAGHHHACVGGFGLDREGRYLVAFATLDNLLKGAATQALQNLNLACGYPELEGIPNG